MKKKKIWIAVAAVAAVLTVLFCAVFVFRPKEHKEQYLLITPEGEPMITLEYGQNYEEAGALAQYICDGENRTVETAVSVPDMQKIGSYLIKYSAAYEGITGTAYRRVSIVDTVAPEITLVADPDRITLPDQVYEEEGFTATDNYDGDITDRVIRTQTHEKVYYTVSDSSGNTTTVERWIAYDDPTPPELTLLGDANHTVLAGVKYVDPGWTAYDNCNGDMTGDVTVGGSVDIYMPGEYVLTYSVTDSYDNTTTVYRTVTVVPQTAPEVVIPEGKVIYLTFDDGPGPDTDRLLDILAKYNVKATFFVMNNGYYDVIKRASDEGHSIGIHTTTHVFKDIYASDEAYLNDVITMREIVEDITGTATTLMRFPGGSSNTVSRRYCRGIMTRMTQKMVELGFQYFDWNVDSDDAGGANSSYTVFMNVIEGVGDRQASVVLMHDIKPYSVDAVERIINWGLSSGYTFLPLEPDSPGCHHGINN